LTRRDTLGVLAAAALAGCARKRPLRVGAKNSTEQTILAEAVAQHLERRLGVPVERRLNLGDTVLAHQALITGQVDLYPEYSGLAFTIVLKLPFEAEPAIVMERLRSEYRLRSAIEWLDPLGSEGGFSMVIRGEDARAGRLTTLSDAAAHATRWRLGVTQEFLEQPTLYRRLMSVYSLPLAAAPRAFQAGALYKALAASEVSMVSGSLTDAALAGADFQVLQDDRNAFPPCQAALAVRADALTRHPDLRQVLDQLAGKFSTEALRKLSLEVEVQHRPVAQVAADYLRRAGLAP